MARVSTTSGSHEHTDQELLLEVQEITGKQVTLPQSQEQRTHNRKKVQEKDFCLLSEPLSVCVMSW